MFRGGNEWSLVHMVWEIKSKQGMFNRAVPYCCKPNEWPEEGNFTIGQNAGINKHVFLLSMLLI